MKIGLNESTSTDVCRQDDDGAEDVEMGKCLQNLNVTSGDSRDDIGKPRFFALVPDQVSLVILTFQIKLNFLVLGSNFSH